jgi:hypothetical protein
VPTGAGRSGYPRWLRNPQPNLCARGAAAKGMTMDEFARMMSMEGVRPLDRLKDRARRPAKQPTPVDDGIVAPPELGTGSHAWVTGPRARTALETALERLATEIRDGRRGWATGVSQDGTTVTLPASSGAAALLGAADRQALRLMIVGGDGWTFVMHPLMGVATLDEDPA